MDRVSAVAPDLVFSDVVMPGISGVELAAELRHKCPGLPVLLTTGYSDDLVQGLSDAAVLVKPYGGKELSEAIRRLLGSRGEEAA